MILLLNHLIHGGFIAKEGIMYPPSSQFEKGFLPPFQARHKNVVFYEKSLAIITSDMNFLDWQEFFGDPVHCRRCEKRTPADREGKQ